jgi:Tol biopolymer transport system component
VGGDVSLVTLDLSTGEQRVLIAPRAFSQLSAPRYDPTSTTILFAATGSGSAPTGLAPSHRFDLGALLVPSALAHGDPQDIWSIAAAGGAPTRRIALQGDDPTEAWSPDASQMAILATAALEIAPASGGKRTSILYPGGSGSVDWAVSGR